MGKTGRYERSERMLTADMNRSPLGERFNWKGGENEFSQMRSTHEILILPARFHWIACEIASWSSSGGNAPGASRGSFERSWIRRGSGR